VSHYQQTLKGPVNIKGVGLHTGAEVTMCLKPAPVNHGIKFQRVDLDEKPIIEANVDYVVDVSRGTTLEKNGVKVATVEHCMAALVGSDLDNVLIEIDNAEVPILDGSAIEFMNAIDEVGSVEQEEERDYFVLDQVINFEENGSEMVAMPSENYQISVMIDFNSPVIGSQHASLHRISDFKKDFASARTFCFLHELEMLLKADLIKGGDLNNAIVIVDRVVEDSELQHLATLFKKDKVTVEKEGILNNVKLRYQNEPARHKLLDVIGDLALVGTPIKGRVIGTKPGHGANVEFAKKLKAHIKNQRKNKSTAPAYDPNEKPLLNIIDIKGKLPHKEPFLLVDKVIHMDERQIVGVKSVTYNEPFFRGHFPDNPIMPGVLQIEALAQTGGLLILNGLEDPENYETYFLKIENAKFKSMVVPGDTLVLKCEMIGEIRRGIAEMKGTAYVGDKISCETQLMAKIHKINP